MVEKAMQKMTPPPVDIIGGCVNEAVADEGEGNIEEVNEDDGRDPLAILPEEVWEIILDMLKCSVEDLMSTCRASLSWNGILNSTKGTWLFVKVFKRLFPHLNKKDILTCRKVCKKWRLVVDSFIEDHPCHRPAAVASSKDGSYDDGDNHRESIYYPLISKQLYQIRFVDTDQLSKFRMEMEHHPTNPLIGRSVSFYSRVQDEWMMAALHFLSAFGKYIWYFSFESSHSPLRFIQWLRQCLTLMPNLRSLHIICLIEAPIDMEHEPNLLDEMMEDLTINPMPSLPYLDSLEICTNNLPKMIQDTLVSTYSRQIHRLQINSWNEAYISEEIYPFDNLKDFYITVDSNECLDSLVDLRYHQLRTFNITLRHTDIDIEKLFKLIQRFENTLQVLKIFLSPGASFVENESGEICTEPFLSTLSFSKLKTLVLVNVFSLSYNFLKEMKSLEYLHMEKWSDKMFAVDMEQEAVQIHYFAECNYLYQSNIWEVLPSLKYMTYYELNNEKQKYNRLTYDYLQRTQSDGDDEVNE